MSCLAQVFKFQMSPLRLTGRSETQEEEALSGGGCVPCWLLVTNWSFSHRAEALGGWGCIVGFWWSVAASLFVCSIYCCFQFTVCSLWDIISSEFSANMKKPNLIHDRILHLKLSAAMIHMWLLVSFWIKVDVTSCSNCNYCFRSVRSLFSLASVKPCPSVTPQLDLGKGLRQKTY